MNRKILFGILAIAVVAIAGTAAFADTWMSKVNKIYIKTGSSQEICLFADCDARWPVGEWCESVEQGGVYEFSLYVLNTGSRMVYITYLPTDFRADGPPGQQQTHFVVTASVIGYGLPCQMIANNIPLPTGVASLPYALPEKNVNVPAQGFPLNPNKMIKIDVEVEVLSVDLNAVPDMFGIRWSIPFEVVAVSI